MGHAVAALHSSLDVLQDLEVRVVVPDSEKEAKDTCQPHLKILYRMYLCK